MPIIREMSDLHNEWYNKHQLGYRVKELETDKETILILAGDIDSKLNAIKSYTDLHKQFIGPDKYTELPRMSWLKELSFRFKHIIYVFGNHDYWGTNIDLATDKIKEKIKQQGIGNISVLCNECVEIDGVLFAGSTMWTDYNDGNMDTVNHAGWGINDFKNIRMGEDYKQLTPYRLMNEHNQTRYYLEQTIKEYDGKVVVVTHHAPSFESVGARFRSQFHTNGCYASRLDPFIEENPNIILWFHGHMHDSCDYMIGNTNVICNPFGYFNYEQNPDFNPTRIFNTDDYNVG